MAATQPAAAPPGHPVLAALDDPEVRNGLLDHARAILGRRSASRPATVRTDLATEAVQETSSQALQNWKQYDPAVGPVRSWLHGIMNNVLRNTVRVLGHQPAQPPVDLAAWERLATDLAPHPDQAVLDRLTAADYLAWLPPEHRQMLHFRFYDDLSNEEIAAHLGISLGNARVRLCRALAAARVRAGVCPEEERP